MGKKIELVYSGFTNDFSDSEFDTTVNLTGSVMERIIYEFYINVSWDFKASTTNSISTNPSLNRITKSSGDFLDDGFSVGDSINMAWTDGSGSYDEDLTITAISGNVMYCSGTIPDSSVGGFLGASVVLTGLTDLTSLIWKPNVIENADTFTPRNIITGSDQAFYFDNITTSTTEGEILGSNEDWVAYKDDEIIATKETSPAYGVQQFLIAGAFFMPFYSEGDDFVTAPDYLNGLNSLKFVFEASFRTTLSNVDSEKTFTYDSSNGSVGYFGENMNGFSSNYSIISTSYEDVATSQPVDSIIATGRTKVSVVVERENGTWFNTDKFGVALSYLPKQSQYTNTPTTYIENFRYNFLVKKFNDAPYSEGDLYLLDALIQGSADRMLVQFEVEYSTADKLFLANEVTNGSAEYAVGILAGDSTLDSDVSDRVMLLADVNNYQHSSDIDGLMQNADMNIFVYDSDLENDDGFDEVTNCIEDGVLVRGQFDLNIDANAKMNSCEFVLLAQNTTTLEYFYLDKYIFNVSNSPIVNGAQELEIKNNRGYRLTEDNAFNQAWLITSRDPTVGGLKTYYFSVGQKFSWQDWIANNNVDNVFFDSLKPNNNLNNKSSNYSGLENYEIKLGIKANIYGTDDNGISGNTDYLFISPPANILDYDTPFDSDYEGLIETFNPSNNANLGGAILGGNADTLFRITWSDSIPFTDPSLYTVVHRIEETNQNGYSIDENGDNRLNPTDNRLINLKGFSEVKTYIDGDDLVSECLIKGSELNSGVTHNLSGTLKLK